MTVSSPVRPQTIQIKPEEIRQQLSNLLQKKTRLLKNGATNNKLAKNTQETWILNLSPYKQNNKGVNLCGHSTPGCRQGCLFTSGLGRLPSVEKTRRLNTEVYIEYSSYFLRLLQQELFGLHLQALESQQTVAVRLNGTSDLDWPLLIKRETGEDILSYDCLLYYDYTKSYKQWEKYLNSSYHLTFSRSEANWLECQWVLEQQGTVAVVFRGTFPSTYQGYPVINGDESDMRWLDPAGHVIALSYKQAVRDDPDSNPFVVKL